MNIKLIQETPVKEGYYLVKFGESRSLHLVLVQLQGDGQLAILSDTCPFRDYQDKKVLNCISTAKQLYFHQLPRELWWSESPIELV